MRHLSPKLSALWIFLWNYQKISWWKSCSFFGTSSLILLVSIWCKPPFEIKFDKFGQFTMLFSCGGGGHPFPHLARVPDNNHIRVKWEKFNCQNLTNFLTKFFTKIGFFELLFFYIFVNISSFRQHIWACSTLFFAYKCQGFTEFNPVLINLKLNL